MTHICHSTYPVKALMSLCLVSLVLSSCAVGSLSPATSTRPTQATHVQLPYAYVVYGSAIYAIDAQTGSMKWTFSAKQPIIYGQPYTANGIVYMGDQGGNVYALRADSGKVLWQAVTSTHGYPVIDASPLVVNGTLYIGGIDEKLYALDATTGKKLWDFQMHGVTSAAPTYFAGDVLVAPFDDGRLYALDARTGALKWSLDQTKYTYYGDLTTDGNALYVAIESEVTALDQNGQTMWSTPLNLEDGDYVSPPTVANGTVYLYSGGQNVFALDAANGALRWANTSIHFSCGSAAVGDGPVVHDGALYFTASSCTQIVAMSTSDGRLLWNTGRVGYISAPGVFDDTVVVGTGNVITGLNPGDASVKWTIQLPKESVDVPGCDEGCPSYIGS